MTVLLVANRGEIARRIFRTARRMGIGTVAVFSEADAGATFVREADVALPIGPAPPRDSYLRPDRILAAAKASGAGLVHPGYGFLAEDPAFAAAVAAAGLTFVGPPAEVLAALGDKGRAKEIAERARVPVLPGHHAVDQRDEAFLEAARRVGYPLMVKPVAGGGGIGMQHVAEESGLRAALARARRAASAAFGDERLLIERAVERPRHVEVQLLADAHGTVLALGERDCSAQRRHQKVLEEAPSPAVGATTREAMSKAAAALARAVGYRNAGTAEFVVAQDGSFHFLEVNARLQVEHPVTEAVFGTDLVEQQLRIALGERLASVPAAPRGHAIEARVYAEDPASGFLPSTGRLAHVRWPDGVRVDAGVEEGDLVTRHYDPLLAKIVAHGPDRAAALAALAGALEETEILGVRTNLAFLRALVAHPAVRAGEVDTGLIGRDLATLAPAGAPAPDEAHALAAAALVSEPPSRPRDPWTTLGPWRLGGAPRALVSLRDGEAERSVEVVGADPVSALGRRLRRGGRHHAWTIDGAPASAAAADGLVWVGWRGSAYALDPRPRDRGVEVLAAEEVVAPMPGVVLAAHVRTGQRVRRGELLFVVEAMKMELRVEAPGDGVVTHVLCAAGDQVARGQRLAEFEPAVAPSTGRASD
ncbi:MAG: acetyl/propionyl/methylcrotonyl-CoA carboxylase subunit alpha [Candidatus Limnocylindria bacterium]